MSHKSGVIIETKSDWKSFMLEFDIIMWPKKKQSQACEREQKTFVLNKDAKGGFEPYLASLK